MTKLDLSGLIVPPTTPFDDRNVIDEASLAAHLEYLAEAGVTRLLVNGTTAEFFSLLPAERLSLLKISKRHFAGTIFFNTASDSLLQAIQTARLAEDEGVDAIVAMAPYYLSDAPAKGIIRFFNELGASVRIPMVLYNFTKHTNNPLTPEMLKEIDHLAIKDASADSSLIGATPSYLAGTSRQIVERVRMGAVGFVSSLATFLPERYVKLERLLREGDMEGAEAAQQEIIANVEKISSDNEIGGIKKELAAVIKGYPERVRLPLV